jgi:hypothetical protein
MPTGIVHHPDKVVQLAIRLQELLRITGYDGSAAASETALVYKGVYKGG